MLMGGNMNILDLSPKQFEKEVRRHLSEWWIGECVYFECIKELNRLNLHKITERDVRRIFRPFLITWGGMSKVLKRRENWEKDVAEVLVRYAKILNKLRKSDLSEISESDLKNFKKEIMKCYDSLKSIIGPTSTAKILHIIAPKFFPLWDYKIRRKYKVSDDPRGYLEFIHKIRKYWLKNSKLQKCLVELEGEFNLSKLRLIDIYNFAVTRQ